MPHRRFNKESNAVTRNQKSLAIATIAFSAGLMGCSDAADKGSEAADSVSSPQTSVVRDVSVSEASELIAGKDAVVVLDVRTPGEFSEGHIAGAINVDVRSEDFAEQLAKLDRGSTYVLHCKSGARSTRALATMQEQGFEDIAHMTGGFDAWTEAGLEQAQ